MNKAARPCTAYAPALSIGSPVATYHSIVLPNDVIPNAAWSYPQPLPGYEAIRDHLAFYVWRVDEAEGGAILRGGLRPSSEAPEEVGAGSLGP